MPRGALVVAVVLFVLGGRLMSNADTVENEAQRLWETLDTYSVDPVLVESGFPSYSDAAKDAVAARALRTFEPPLPGRLLARLLFIQTKSNRIDLIATFLSNLHSPEAEARKASFFALEKLDHPAIVEIAVASLRDPFDPIVFGACNVLIPRAKDDLHLRALLHAVYAAHATQPQFYMSNELLRAHGFDKPENQ